MNAFAPSLPSFNAPSKKTLWLLALVTPAMLCPIWCLMLGGLSAQLGTASGLVLCLLLVTTSITDLSKRKIFNWATYSAVAWAMAINAASIFSTQSASQLGAVGLQQSLLGFAGCFAVMLFPYVLARGGAGDVKLAAAIGALIGLEQGVLVIAISYILAGVAILSWSIWTQGPWKLVVAMGRFFGSLFLPLWIQPPTKTDRVLLNKPIPLAGFFAVGTLIVVLGLI